MLSDIFIIWFKQYSRFPLLPARGYGPRPPRDAQNYVLTVPNPICIVFSLYVHSYNEVEFTN